MAPQPKLDSPTEAIARIAGEVSIARFDSAL
jgi:hypothetical protein